MNNYRYIVFFILLGLISSQSFAANPNSGSEINSIRNDFLKSLPKQPAFIPEDIIPKSFHGKMDSSKVYNVKFYLDKFEFEGNTLFSSETLAELLKDNLGKTHDFASLVRMSKIITDFYRKSGAFVAQTYIPVQKLDAKSLKLSIVEGKIGAVLFDQDNLVSKKVITDFTRVLVPGEVLMQKNLERAMLLLNELSGITGRSFLKPGKLKGTTEVNIKLSKDTRFDGYVSLNNNSSESTGRYSGVVNIRANNTFKNGGNISMLGSLTRAGGTDYFGLNTKNYFGYKDWAFTTNYSLIKTETVYGQFADLGLSSHNYILGVGITRPLIRTYKDSLDFSFNFNTEHYRQNNGFFGDSFVDKLNNVTMAVNGVHKDNYGFYEGMLSVETGLTKLDAARSSDIYATGTYYLLKFNFSRLQAISPRNTLVANLQTQYAHDRVLSVKQFAVGGSQKVKAFSSSEGLGERGYTFGLEWRFLAVADKQISKYINAVQPYAFFNIGRSLNNKTLPGQIDNRTLQGYGAGLRATLFKNLSIDVSHARRLDHGKAITDDLRNERTSGQVVYFMRF